jgi:hypothetical protein
MCTPCFPGGKSVRFPWIRIGPVGGWRWKKTTSPFAGLSPSPCRIATALAARKSYKKQQKKLVHLWYRTSYVIVRFCVDFVEIALVVFHRRVHFDKEGSVPKSWYFVKGVLYPDGLHRAALDAMCCQKN